MTKHIITAIAATALLLGACSKKGKNDDCSTGTLRFSNTSKNPYNISANNSSYGALQGGKFIEKDLPKGPYNLKAEQISGYVLYPTVKTLDVDIKGCDDQEFVFP